MIILFDLDGTLIDSTEAILESFGVAFKTFNQPTPSDEAIKLEIGYPLEDMFVTLGVKEDEVNAYVHAYKMHYRVISCQKTVLLEGAKEAIALAKSKAILGVVTTKTAQYSIELLEYMGVMEAFDVLIGREDVENPKPHPEPILKALSKLPADDTLYMIGDTPMDMLSAKASGVIGIGVSCGYGTKASLEKITPKVYKNALDAIKSIVVEHA